MKNALWFLYKPQDERERELYYHAYARSFNFLMAALMIGFMLLKWLSYDSLRGFTSPSLLFLSIAILIVVSYYLGWKTLQKEEITVNAQFSSRLPSPYMVWGILGGVVMGSIISQIILNYYQLPPENYYRQMVNGIFLVVGAVVVRIIAWLSTNKLQLPVRIGLVLAFPLLTILVSRMEGKTLSDRIIKALAWLLIPVVIIMIIAVSFFMRSFSSSSRFISMNAGFHLGGHYFPIASSTKLDLSKPLFSTSTQDGITTYKDLLYRFQFSYPVTMDVNYSIPSGHNLPSDMVLKLSNDAQITISSYPKIKEESPRNIEKRGFKKVMINTVQAWQKTDEVSDKEVITTTFYGEDSQYYFTYENSVRGDQNNIGMYNKVLESFQSFD